MLCRGGWDAGAQRDQHGLGVRTDDAIDCQSEAFLKCTDCTARLRADDAVWLELEPHDGVEGELYPTRIGSAAGTTGGARCGGRAEQADLPHPLVDLRAVGRFHSCPCPLKSSGTSLFEVVPVSGGGAMPEADPTGGVEIRTAGGSNAGKQFCITSHGSRQLCIGGAVPGKPVIAHSRQGPPGIAIELERAPGGDEPFVGGPLGFWTGVEAVCRSGKGSATLGLGQVGNGPHEALSQTLLLRQSFDERQGRPGPAGLSGLGRQSRRALSAYYRRNHVFVA